MRNFMEKLVICLYCGYGICLILDVLNGSQEFYDDCLVCCYVIYFNMIVDELYDIIELYVDVDDE